MMHIILLSNVDPQKIIVGCYELSLNMSPLRNFLRI